MARTKTKRNAKQRDAVALTPAAIISVMKWPKNCTPGYTMPAGRGQRGAFSFHPLARGGGTARRRTGTTAT